MCHWEDPYRRRKPICCLWQGRTRSSTNTLSGLVNCPLGNERSKCHRIQARISLISAIARNRPGQAFRPYPQCRFSGLVLLARYGITVLPSLSAASRNSSQRQALNSSAPGKISGSLAVQYAEVEINTPAGILTPSERVKGRRTLRLNETVPVKTKRALLQ